MYYGWRVVFVTAVVFVLVVGSTYSAFGLFVLPVAADLNLSRAEVNTALILLNAGSAVLAPVSALFPVSLKARPRRSLRVRTVKRYQLWLWRHRRRFRPS